MSTSPCVMLKGQKICGPDGQGYEIAKDVHPGDPVMADQFKPFGGAPEPRAGDALPDWCAAAIKARA